MKILIKLHPAAWVSSFICIVLLLPSLSTPQVTIEFSGTSKPLHYPSCDNIDLKKETFVTCICLKGIWALLVATPNGQSGWKILGGNRRGREKSKCLHLGQWVRKLHRISKSSSSPKVSRLYENSDTFIVVHSQDWEINMESSHSTSKNKYCLSGSIPASYCLYNMKDINKKLGEGGPIHEKDFYPNCTNGSQVLEATDCQAFSPSIFEKYEDNNNGSEFGSGNNDFGFDFEENAHHPFVCSIIPPKPQVFYSENGEKYVEVHDKENVVLRRQKRAGPLLPTPYPKPLHVDSKEIDEEYISPEKLANYHGTETMMNSITDYMLSGLIKISELNPVRKKRDAFELPVTRLLRLSGNIMKKICGAINQNLFDIAMESFLIQQKTVYQLREPYIGYAPYNRILQSLENCYAEAAPFKFFMNASAPNTTFYHCETTFPPITTQFVWEERLSQYVLSAEVPQYAASDPESFEPITELVWKMFVNAHSFCYKYFLEYYNDHHAYTVSLMPFFTNEIQNIWLLRNDTRNGTDLSALNSSGNLNYSTSKVWYGNVLGDISTLYYALDHCYSATRKLHQDYPWFMNRPPADSTNMWRRRKRDVSDSDGPPTSPSAEEQGVDDDASITKMPCEEKTKTAPPDENKKLNRVDDTEKNHGKLIHNDKTLKLDIESTFKGNNEVSHISNHRNNENNG